MKQFIMIHFITFGRIGVFAFLAPNNTQLLLEFFNPFTHVLIWSDCSWHVIGTNVVGKGFE